ncbi:hypothetical protein D3C71_1422760 [compost metagenome]
MKICTSSGVPRTNSTYTVDRSRRVGLFDSRHRPANRPITRPNAPDTTDNQSVVHRPQANGPAAQWRVTPIWSPSDTSSPRLSCRLLLSTSSTCSAPSSVLRVTRALSPEMTMSCTVP